MIISYQWLCEWVSPPSDIARLCDSLTMAGLEVSSANALSLLSNRVVVGEVLTVETIANHPGLHLCCVDTGHTRSRTICLLYTSPSPRDGLLSRRPSSA